MQNLRPLALTCALLALSACKPAPTGHDHAPEAVPAELPPATNPVQNEMRILHDAARDWVTAIANGTLATIPPSIERVHGARILTEKALESGAYKPPKNGDAIEAFKQQDEAFHGELVKLLRASKANDLPGTARQLGVVFEGCTACHSKYRM